MRADSNTFSHAPANSASPDFLPGSASIVSVPATYPRRNGAATICRRSSVFRFFARRSTDFFTAPMPSTPKLSMPIRPGLAIAIVAIVVAALMFQRIGASDVCNANEAVEGVFVQQMVEHGKLLFPLENGTVPMYKPPLFHWTAAAIDYVAGIRKVTPANLRFPSALYATVGAILTMIFAYKDRKSTRLNSSHVKISYAVFCL